jgi:hypothetical protein
VKLRSFWSGSGQVRVGGWQNSSRECFESDRAFVINNDEGPRWLHFFFITGFDQGLDNSGGVGGFGLEVLGCGHLDQKIFVAVSRLVL